MPRYMLDTDISSYLMNQSNSAVLRNLQLVAVSDVCISAISRSELEYGVAVSPRRDRDQRNLAILLQHIQVLDYPGEASLDYAQIRARLKTRGAIIGANDLLIAAHARCMGLILVTNNTREFSRVPALRIENWA
jgi:tRNA(fMet)-specific endonuclease VapC